MWLAWLMNIELGVSVRLYTDPVRGSEVKWLNAACVGGVSAGWGWRVNRDEEEQ